MALVDVTQSPSRADLDHRWRRRRTDLRSDPLHTQLYAPPLPAPVQAPDLHCRHVGWPLAHLAPQRPAPVGKALRRASCATFLLPSPSTRLRPTTPSTESGLLRWRLDRR